MELKDTGKLLETKLAEVKADAGEKFEQQKLVWQERSERLMERIRGERARVKETLNRQQEQAVRKATEFVVTEALDREEPKAMTTIVNAMENLIGGRGFMMQLEEGSRALQAEPTETVELLSRDGELLLGHYWKRTNPKRLVIAFHGWRSSWSRDFGNMRRLWSETDSDVLFVEQRGQNGSTGEFMGFGLTERYDCLDWLSWACEHVPESLPIYLHGMSMGASTVLMASGFGLNHRVHGITADCGYTSPEAIWMKVATENFHVPYEKISDLAEAQCRKKLNMGLNAYSTLEAMKVNTTPVLFIHGTDDHFVPVEMTYENYEACRAAKYLFTVEGADHGQSFYKDPEGYLRAERDFFSLYD